MKLRIGLLALCLLLIAGYLVLEVKPHYLRSSEFKNIFIFGTPDDGKLENGTQMCNYYIIQPQRDTLFTANYLHFLPNNKAILDFAYSLKSEAFISPAQINLPSYYHTYAYDNLNSYNETFFPNLQLPDTLITHDNPVRGVITPEGNLVMLLRDYAGGRLYQVRCLWGKQIVAKINAPRPLCFVWSNAETYVLCYLNDPNDASLWVLPVESVSEFGKTIYKNPNSKPIRLSGFEGVPIFNRMRFFRMDDNGFLALPYTDGTQQSCFLVNTDNWSYTDLKPSDPQNGAIIPLGHSQNKSRIYFAERIPRHKRSDVFSLDYHFASKKTISQIASLAQDGCMNLAADKLILLTDKGINAVHLEDGKVQNHHLKGYNRINGAFEVREKELYTAFSEKNSRLCVFDSDLVVAGKLDYSDGIMETISTYISDQGGKQDFDAVYIRSTDNDILQIGYYKLHYYPRELFANLAARTKQLGLGIWNEIKAFFSANPLVMMLFILLFVSSLTISLVLSRRFLENRIKTFKSYIPMPVDVKDAHRMLKQLQSPILSDVAVLNVDIVGFSTMVTNHADKPELLQEIMEGFFQAFIEESFKCGGTIGKIMGDGIIAIFGWPDLPGIKHNTLKENLQKALQAGMAMLQRELGKGGLQVQVRLGLTTGEVYIGHFGNRFRKDYLAIGEALNESEHIQKSAEPGKLSLTRKIATYLDLPFEVARILEIGDQELEVTDLIPESVQV